MVCMGGCVLRRMRACCWRSGESALPPRAWLPALTWACGAYAHAQAIDTYMQQLNLVYVLGMSLQFVTLSVAISNAEQMVGRAPQVEYGARGASILVQIMGLPLVPNEQIDSICDQLAAQFRAEIPCAFMCTKFDSTSGNYLRRAQNGKMRAFLVVDRDRFAVPVTGRIRVNVTGDVVTVIYNRYTNLHVFDDSYLQCCGRVDSHAPTCRFTRRQERQVRAPQPGPAHPVQLKFAPAVLAAREKYAEETAAEIFHMANDAGYLPDLFRGEGKMYKCKLRICRAWVFSHGDVTFTACVPCNTVSCSLPAHATLCHARACAG